MLTSFLFSWVCVLSSCSNQVYQEVTAKGVDAGLHRITVYWLAEESTHSSREQRTLWGRKDRLLAPLPKDKAILWAEQEQQTLQVSRAFAQQLRMQGSGVLTQGQLVQYLGGCTEKNAVRPCFRIRFLDRRRYPMSVGALGTKLHPFHSLAVDSRYIPLGGGVYIPILGQILRQRGYAHDGCFGAHDRGGRIRGAKIDLFVGWSRWFFRRLGSRLPRYVRLYLHHPACSGKKF